MTITLEDFNRFSPDDAKETLKRCCGSSAWVERVSGARPFATLSSLQLKAQSVWQSLSEEDWLEAFKHHPRIGDLSSLKAKFANTKQWAAQEQKGTTLADEGVLVSLADHNQKYLDKFGYIFIICATGKSAQEMLQALQERPAP